MPAKDYRERVIESTNRQTMTRFIGLHSSFELATYNHVKVEIECNVLCVLEGVHIVLRS